MTEESLKTRIEYAGFWIRVLADLIDSLLIDGAILLLLVLAGALFWEDSMIDEVGAVWVQAVFLILRAIVGFAYFTFGHYRYGTTLGKRPMRIYVISGETLPESGAFSFGIPLWQSTLRSLSYGVSYALLGAGFLMAAFHPRKQALHDWLAGTISVVRKP